MHMHKWQHLDLVVDLSSHLGTLVLFFFFFKPMQFLTWDGPDTAGGDCLQLNVKSVRMKQVVKRN